MTAKEAAGVLDCSLSFVYKLMRIGQLAYEKRGRRKLPLDASVAEYRQRNVVPARHPPARGANQPNSAYRFKHLFT